MATHGGLSTQPLGNNTVSNHSEALHAQQSGPGITDNLNTPGTPDESQAPSVQWQKQKRKKRHARSQNTTRGKGNKPNQIKTSTTTNPQKKSRRILVLPPEENQGPAIKCLEDSEIDPTEAGIKDIPVTFPSGAAIIVVQEDKMDQFREAMEKTGLREKKTVTRAHEFRVHGIPATATAQDITQALEYRTGRKPQTITLSKYKSNELQVANCTCTGDMYAALENIYTLFIRYRKCKVDTKPNLLTCQKCYTLGHTSKHCPYGDDEASRMKSDAKNAKKPCLDCTAHNKKLKESKSATAMRIDSRHQTRDSTCPIFRKHIRKYYLSREGPSRSIETNDENILAEQEPLTQTDAQG